MVDDWKMTGKLLAIKKEIKIGKLLVNDWLMIGNITRIGKLMIIDW